MDQGEKISFKPALAQPGETTTSKNKTGTDQKFVANSVYELRNILFMLIYIIIIHETVSRNLKQTFLGFKDPVKVSSLALGNRLC